MVVGVVVMVCWWRWWWHSGGGVDVVAMTVVTACRVGSCFSCRSTIIKCTICGDDGDEGGDEGGGSGGGDSGG